MTADEKLEKQRAYAAKWRAEHPELVKASADRFRAANPGYARARSAKWRAENPERAKELGRSWAAQHPDSSRKWKAVNAEKERVRRAQWALDHPGQIRAKGHRRRVLLRGGVVEKFLDTEIFERDGYICGLCGEPIDRTLRGREPASVSLDHIVPVSKGGAHTRANVQAAHLACNSGKRDKVSDGC